VSVEVSDRPARHRYEIVVDGAPAGFSAYRVVDQDRWAFTHTEIDRNHEHQGLGTVLVTEAMADMQRRGIAVLPECPFVRDHLSEHPQVAVVPEDARASFGL
jgi:uncharacterized protein